MKKHFKAFCNDSEGSPYWQVWAVAPEHLGYRSLRFRCAEFYGKYCRRFAYAHAKTLNALPEKDSYREALSIAWEALESLRTENNDIHYIKETMRRIEELGK